jgi:hypothetical protein
VPAISAVQQTPKQKPCTVTAVGPATTHFDVTKALIAYASSNIWFGSAKFRHSDKVPWPDCPFRTTPSMITIIIIHHQQNTSLKIN